MDSRPIVVALALTAALLPAFAAQVSTQSAPAKAAPRQAPPANTQRRDPVPPAGVVSNPPRGNSMLAPAAPQPPAGPPARWILIRGEDEELLVSLESIESISYSDGEATVSFKPLIFPNGNSESRQSTMRMSLDAWSALSEQVAGPRHPARGR